MNKLYLIIPVIAIVFGVAYGNIGFTPEYLPSHSTYPYAQFSDSTTQVCPDDVPGFVLINTNDSIYGFTHSEVTDTHVITVDQRGVYMIIAAPQIGKTTQGANGNHNFWLVINGTDVENTNINGELDAATSIDASFVNVLNWVGFLNQNSTVSFRQLCTGPNLGLIFTDQTVDIPSIIVSIIRVS